MARYEPIPRVIPVLLLRDGGLVKTVKFDKPKYVGDPINALRIFNEKEVDELALLDITATVTGREPPFDLIRECAGECFMPLLYGGGVQTVAQCERILKLGVEKVCVNTAAVERPGLVGEAARLFGSQSVVVSVDVRRSLLGRYEVCVRSGRQKTGMDPVAFARQMEEQGAGEIILHSIDRDGTMAGYDLELIKRVAGAVTIPVVATGGAGGLQDLVLAVKEGGASAVAAGSIFVFHGKHRAVLISFPTYAERVRAFR